MKEISTKRILKYNIRSCRVTVLPNPKTKKCGTDTEGHKAVQIGNMLPARYENLSSLYSNLK